MKRHAGFTTFTVTLILLIILIGISLLVAKVMVIDRRVSVNEVQYRQALALAELGLADGVGHLSQDPAWRTTNGTGSAVTGSYKLQVFDDLAGAISIGASTSVTPVVVSSAASLVDGTTEAAVQVKTITVKLLAGTPAAPLTVAGMLDLQGSFNAVANPNGGGLGVPLSVWSDEPLDVKGGGNWKTCHLGNFDGVGCNASISDKDNVLSDIKLDDPKFPDDLVKYLFNENDDEIGWLNIEKRASQIVSDCSGLNALSSGIIIVKGTMCTIPDVVGSETNPVVLIVRDGNLQMNGKKEFNGLIFAHVFADNPIPDSKLGGGATVNGAIVANYPLKITAGTFNAKYDGAVLANISNGALFQVVSILPGSWRDW